MEDKKFKKVNSPEQLNQYIRLSNPGVWILLLAIVVLLVGVCIWGYFGKIDTKIKTVVISDNYTPYLYVKEEDMAKIKNGMQVELNNNENIFEIADIEETPEKVTDDMDEYARHLGNFQVGEWVYKCRLNKNVKEGTYSANIIIESIAPMTFITN
ncbi:hypothetical protein SAMN02910289_00844 [Lachnospiraceae bacterium RM5]|nr:hypothetical protein SAMN02910289_00844 [Lachnospiraceae bacterium RM5]